MNFTKRLSVILVALIVPILIFGQEVSEDYYSPQKVIRGKKKLIYGHISANTMIVTGGEFDFDFGESVYPNLGSTGFGFNDIGFDIGQFVQFADHFAFSVSYQNYRIKTNLKDEDDNKYPLENNVNEVTGRMYYLYDEYMTFFGGFSYTPIMYWTTDYRGFDYAFEKIYGIQLGLRMLMQDFEAKYRGINFDLWLGSQFGSGTMYEGTSEVNMFNLNLNLRLDLTPPLAWKIGLYFFIEGSGRLWEQMTFPDYDERKISTQGGRGRLGVGFGW